MPLNDSSNKIVRHTYDDRLYLQIVSAVYYVLGCSMLIVGFAILIFILRGQIDLIYGRAAVIIFSVFGIAHILSAYFMSKALYRYVSIALAVVISVGFPLGTAIGVPTIAVLCREGVRKMYMETTRKGKVYREADDAAQIRPADSSGRNPSVTQADQTYMALLLVLCFIFVAGIVGAFQVTQIPANRANQADQRVMWCVMLVETLYLIAIGFTLLLRFFAPATGRTVSKALNIVLLPIVPFGTAVGIYGLLNADKGT
jgi:hypothetical protein